LDTSPFWLQFTVHGTLYFQHHTFDSDTTPSVLKLPKVVTATENTETITRQLYNRLRGPSGLPITASLSRRQLSFACVRRLYGGPYVKSYCAPLRHVRQISRSADCTSFHFHSMSVRLSAFPLHSPTRQLELLAAASVTAASVTVSDTRCISVYRRSRSGNNLSFPRVQHIFTPLIFTILLACLVPYLHSSVASFFKRPLSAHWPRSS
jgi:hypothetical protein